MREKGRLARREYFRGRREVRVRGTSCDLPATRDGYEEQRTEKNNETRKSEMIQ